MAWDALLLCLVAGYSSYKTWVWFRHRDRYLFGAYFLASVFYGVIQVTTLMESIAGGTNLTGYVEVTTEWGHIVVISLVLSAMAILIRDSKPDFAKFPFVYTLLPLLIIISYIWIKDTLAIKQWLMGIYQGGAILVAIMVYSVYTYREPRYRMVLLSSILFAVTFGVYWFIPLISGQFAWAWQILLGSSILAALYGYGFAMEYETGSAT